MRMQLKNKEKKIKINLKQIITIKNLKIFLLSFFLISMIIGIIFFLFLKEANKDLITNNIKEYFALDDSYNYLLIFKNTVLNNTFNIFLIWILGISVIGILVVVIIIFIELFGLGISIMAIINTYGFKGLLISFLYIFPSKLLYLLILFITAYASILFSFKLIKIIFVKSELKINEIATRYIKILFILILFIICYSILEVFVSPLMIKIANIVL